MNVFGQSFRVEICVGFDVQTSGHAQMNEQMPIVIERKINLFAASFGTNDARVLSLGLEGFDVGQRSARQARPTLHDGLSNELRFELGAHGFGFGKFWHSEKRRDWARKVANKAENQRSDSASSAIFIKWRNRPVFKASLP